MFDDVIKSGPSSVALPPGLSAAMDPRRAALIRVSADRDDQLAAETQNQLTELVSALALCREHGAVAAKNGNVLVAQSFASNASKIVARITDLTHQVADLRAASAAKRSSIEGVALPPEDQPARRKLITTTASGLVFDPDRIREPLEIDNAGIAQLISQPVRNQLNFYIEADQIRCLETNQTAKTYDALLALTFKTLTLNTVPATPSSPCQNPDFR
jgi:hypothetical protein